MRIISGIRRGMILKTIDGLATRPTSDRAKESLFNILSQKVCGSIFLDLFAGSGACGIEAASRGAKLSFFVENSGESLKCLEGNIKKARFEENSRIIKSDVFSFLASTPEKFDIIFLDPPYHKGYAEKALEIISERGLLKENGIAVAECDHDEVLPQTAGKLSKTDCRKYGRAMFNFYR